VVTILALLMTLAKRVFSRIPDIPRSTLGGVVFGLVGVALPLTLFTGSAQLTTVLHDASTLGAGLLAAIVIAKIFTFAVSQGSGFIGGPIFPSEVGGLQTAPVLIAVVTAYLTMEGVKYFIASRRAASAGRPEHAR